MAESWLLVGRGNDTPSYLKNLKLNDRILFELETIDLAFDPTYCMCFLKFLQQNAEKSAIYDVISIDFSTRKFLLDMNDAHLKTVHQLIKPGGKFVIFNDLPPFIRDEEFNFNSFTISPKGLNKDNYNKIMTERVTKHKIYVKESLENVGFNLVYESDWDDVFMQTERTIINHKVTLTIAQKS